MLNPRCGFLRVEEMKAGMEFTRKNAVVAAGLSAVLALTPVAVPASMAFAGDGDGSAVEAQSESNWVGVRVNNEVSTCLLPDQAAYVSDWAKDAAPEGQEFTGLWTVTWQDGTSTEGKSLDELAGSWANVANIMAEYKDASQGGDVEAERFEYTLINDDGSYIGTGVAYEGQTLEQMNAYFSGSSDVTGLFTAPEREGYEFAGWYVQDGTDSPIDLSTTYAVQNLTLVAHWTPVSSPEDPVEQINVTFEYDGTTVATVADENGNVDAAGLGLPENYTWSWTDSEGTVHEFGSDMLAGYIFTESCTVTGVAQPVEEPAEQIDVTFKFADTTFVATAGEDGKLSSDIVKQLPENYTWSWTDSEGTVHEFGSDMLAGYIFTESCTVTGVAQEIEEPAQQLDVTFEFDNTTLATVAGEDGKISSDIVSQLPENYTWTWTDAQGTVHEFGSELLAGYIFTESCTVTGVANQTEDPADQIDVTFKFDNTTLATVAGEDGTISADTLKQLPGDYTWTWTDAQGTVHEFGSELLANYIFTESCTVTGVANQTEEPAAPREIKVNYYDGDQLLGTGSVFDGTSQWSGVANPQKDGYTFLGWQFEGEDAIYTDAELDNVVYAADPAVTEINLYAQWQENAAEDPEAQYITVHFYDEFGTFLGDGAVLNGTSDWSGPIVAPELDGYTFIGWAEEGGSVYSPALLGWVVVSVPSNVTELTYIAHYEQVAPAAETFKVTFDDCIPATENQVVEVESGETVAKPADPTCDGWTFLGWFTDTALTQEYDFSAPVTSDMTLYAKWQQNEAVDPGTDDPATTPADSAAENGEQAADEAAASDEQKLPQTGDNTMAVAGGVAAVAGVSALAALGAALKRRFQ